MTSSDTGLAVLSGITLAIHWTTAVIASFIIIVASTVWVLLKPVRIAVSVIGIFFWPVKYLLQHTTAVVVSVVAYLWGEFEPIFMFFGVAITLGIFIGLSCNLLSTGITSVLGWTTESKPSRTTKASDTPNTDASSWDPIPSPPVSDDEFPVTPAPRGAKGKGKMPMTSGRSLLSQTIHEEEDSF